MSHYLRSKFPKELKTQYELLGFEFHYHQHGNSPFHYTTEIDKVVFEIYPFSQSVEEADRSLRIGFVIDSLPTKMESIRNSSWIISRELCETEWGMQAILRDLEGRKVELTNRSKN